jgi:hypothetical protein
MLTLIIMNVILRVYVKGAVLQVRSTFSPVHQACIVVSTCKLFSAATIASDTAGLALGKPSGSAEPCQITSAYSILLQLAS